VRLDPCLLVFIANTLFHSIKQLQHLGRRHHLPTVPGAAVFADSFACVAVDLGVKCVLRHGALLYEEPTRASNLGEIIIVQI